MEKSFFEYDPNCRFIPFLKTKKSYSSALAALIKKHSDLMKTTQRLSIPDLMLDAKVQFTTNNFDTIKKVLMSTNDADSPLIHDIDIAPNGSTNIMYYIEQDSELEAFLRTIPSLLAKHIVKEDISKVYKNSTSVDKLLSQRRVTSNEMKFWDEMETSLGINPQDPEAISTSTSSIPKTKSYAAAAAPSASHTAKPFSAVLPQDKRLTNMEHSVTAIQKDYMTKADVEALVKEHSFKDSSPPSVTPDSINSMIDAKLEQYSPTSQGLSQDDVQALIDKAAKSTDELLSNSKQIQTLIDDSISKIRDELKVTHEKLAKSILAVSNTTTNLSASITALQEQNKELSDLFFDKLSPAISPSKAAGANAS